MRIFWPSVCDLHDHLCDKFQRAHWGLVEDEEAVICGMAEILDGTWCRIPAFRLKVWPKVGTRDTGKTMQWDCRKILRQRPLSNGRVDQDLP